MTKAPKPPPVPDRREGAARERQEDGLRPRLPRAVKKGKGKVHPKATDTVEVHYTGWTTDGKMFDSSVTRGEPAEFPLTQRHQGLDRGRAAMMVGDKHALLDPRQRSPTATSPTRPGAPAGMLVFDIELLAIK